MKRSVLIRLLCALLCVTMLAGAFTGPMFVRAIDDGSTEDIASADSDVSTLLRSGIPAADAQEDAADVQEDAAEEDAAAADADDEVAAVPDTDTATADSIPELETGGIRGLIGKALDFFFNNFGFIGFIFDPYQFTIINQKPVFQWALGFNDLYDVFTWVVNVWADTFKCEFNYEGKDWRIQFWKGGYGVFLATGGEIGIYNKSETQKLAHYNCPASQDDWFYLKYTIYNKGEALFTRPSPYLEGDVDAGPYWWAPGYKVLSICSDFLSSPRSNVIMDATLWFKTAEMADAFIAQLEPKGFKLNEAPESMGISTPETYYFNAEDNSLRLVWQNINEGAF